MTSILTVEKWLYGKLTSDTTLQNLIGSRVYHNLAPKKTTMPYLLFSLVNAVPSRVVGANVLWYDELWQVKGVDDGRSYGGLGTILNRVRVLLDKSSGTVTGGIVVACIEVGNFSYPEDAPGEKEFRHLGLEFRIYSQ